MFFTKNIIFLLSFQAPAILLDQESDYIINPTMKPEKAKNVEISLNPQSGQTELII